MSRPSIEKAEFKARQSVLGERLSEEGLGAALVWSLGGSSHDWQGDVMYLTDHHALMPHIATNPALSGSGHAAAIVTADGHTTLITTTLDDPDDRVVADEVVQVPHLPARVAQFLVDSGLSKERIGLVGRETLLESHGQALREGLGGNAELIPFDRTLEEMRSVKSPAELEMLRHAASCGRSAMAAIMNSIAEGATEADVVASGLAELVRRGGVQYDFAIAAGETSKHYWGSSGVPHWNAERSMSNGDLVHVDMWGPVNGYYTDFARSTVVGGDPQPDQLELLEGAIGIIESLCETVRVGMAVGDLHTLAVEWLSDQGFVDSTGENETGANFGDMFPGFGHSLGLSVESPWIVASEDWQIEAGMVLAIEAVIGRPGVGAANFEHNLIVHGDRIEILTADSPTRPWLDA